MRSGDNARKKATRQLLFSLSFLICVGTRNQCRDTFPQESIVWSLSWGRSALVWWQRWQLISPCIKQEVFDLTVMIKHIFPFLMVCVCACAPFFTEVLWFSTCRYRKGWGMCSTKALLTLDGVTLELQLTCFFVTCFHTLSKPCRQFLPPGNIQNRFQVLATLTIDKTSNALNLKYFDN